jgi:HD-like signal output (HDOD) protein
MHDIGRAALLAGNDAQTQLYGDLIAEVAEVTAVEHFLYGQDHGSIGAAILEGWSFPEKLCGAVREHHDPEMANNLITQVLYLVEYVTESGEDLPSRVRLTASASALGISMPDLVRCIVEPASSWSVLRYAA